jgi:hypothetical protein
MKTFNKKRLEKLEEIQTTLGVVPVIMFDSNAPRPKINIPEGCVRIFLPHNGRDRPVSSKR